MQLMDPEPEGPSKKRRLVKHSQAFQVCEIVFKGRIQENCAYCLSFSFLMGTHNLDG